MKPNKQKNISNIWQEVALAEVGVFFKGSGITKDQLVINGHNAIRYGELYTRFDGKIQKIFSHIADEALSEATQIKYGDILFAGSGETIDEIGKSAAYLLKETCYAGGDIIIFRPHEQDSVFLSYFLNVGLARKRLRELGQGQSVVHLYKRDLEKLTFLLPPLPEQRRIVSVLETWDIAIEKLARKIEIKKNIKKGLMQKLLTGKVRLPGFSGEWREVRLGELGNLVSGGTPSKSNETYWQGTVPWISSSDLVEDDIKQCEIKKYITTEAVKVSATRLIPKQSVVIVNRVGIGKMIINDFDLCTSQDFLSLIPHDHKEVYTFFIAYYLVIEIRKLVERNQGTSIKGILKKDLESLIIKLPTYAEQVEIATCISGSDRTMEYLEIKLNLLKQQKNYLLNNLVTGRIRVPAIY